MEPDNENNWLKAEIESEGRELWRSVYLGTAKGGHEIALCIQLADLSYAAYVEKFMEK
jgi:hypothetical protein